MSADGIGEEATLTTKGMAELLEGMEGVRAVRLGEVVEGHLVRIDSDSLLVSVGNKIDGVVPQREMRSLSPDVVHRLQVGDSILVYVVQPGDGEGQALLSLDRAQEEKSWRTLEQHLENSRPIEGQIIGFNRGGAVVDLDGVQGFVPLSQLAPIPRDAGDSLEVLARRVEERVQFQVLELNRRRRRVVLSERAVLQAQREEQRDSLLQSLQPGSVCTGRVTSICNFGAFVDMGGAEGLIHISELSWDRIGSPDAVVSLGDEVEVYVLDVDREAKRIALSLRRLQPEPWDTIGERYQVGQLVSGRVTKLMPYGVFAKLEEDSIEGLVHISELSDNAIQHPKQVVKEGDILRLKILSIEPERRRLGLSLRQADEP